MLSAELRLSSSSFQSPKNEIAAAAVVAQGTLRLYSFYAKYWDLFIRQLNIVLSRRVASHRPKQKFILELDLADMTRYGE